MRCQIVEPSLKFVSESVEKEDGRMILMRSCEKQYEDRKHGSASEWILLIPRPPMSTGSEACFQENSSMTVLQIFSSELLKRLSISYKILVRRQAG